MSRGILAAALAVVIGGGAVVANETGFLGSGGSRSAGLFAAEVSLAPDVPAGSVEGAQALEIVGSAIDCAPAGAGPEDTQQRFFQEGEAFEVTGALTSFDAVTAVVNGPNGNVSANLAQEFELRGDLSPGSMVEMTGSVTADGAMTAQKLHSACAAAGVIDCAGADDPHFELWVAAGSFEVTGRLESLTNDQIRVIGPGLIVEIARDAGTQVDASVKAGDPVKVEGTVLDDQSLRALALALRCEAALVETPAPVSPAPAAPSADAVADEGETEGDNNDDEPCNHRPRGRGALRYEVDDGKAEIKRGAVLSWNGTVFSVETPVGPVTVLVDEDTEVKGDLDAAVDIRVEGDLQDDGSILAEEIKVLCPAGNSGSSANDEDNGEDEGEGNGGGRGRGNGKGNGNGNNRGNGDKDESEDDGESEDDD